MRLPTSQPVRIKTKSYLSTLGKGINNGIPSFDIDIDMASDESNLDSRAYPALNVRTPRKDHTTALSGTLYHLGKHENNYLTAVDGTTWKYWTGSAWSNILTGLSGTAPAESVDFMDKVLLVNGTDNKYWDGVSTTGDIATMPDANYLAVHDNRVYAASNDNNELNFSALRIYDDWTTSDDAGTIFVDTEDGEYGSGLVTYNNHIIYFKKHSMHELYGSGPLDFSFQTLTEQIGCVSHRSIKEVNGMLFWLGQEGVYVYTGGTLPKLLSHDELDGTFEIMDLANASKACAGTDGVRYYLNIPITGGTYLTATYDTNHNVWHIEDTSQFTQFEEFNNVFYGLNTATKKVQTMVDATGTEEISWSWYSKRFLFDSISFKKCLRYLYILADLPTGSTLKAAISTEDGSYVDVKTFTAGSDIQCQKISIPLANANDSTWFQIKLYGTGICTIHKMEMLLRMKGNVFLNG